MNVECGFDYIDGKHVPTIKVFLDPCGPDDNVAWEQRDALAKRVKEILPRADGGVLCSDGYIRYPNKPSLLGYD